MVDFTFPVPHKTGVVSLNLTPVMANENLAVIPDDWSVTQYPNIFLDSSVVHTAGKPSVRLEPHREGVDTNHACEVDSRWYTIKPGDRIVAKLWIKISAGTPTEAANIYDGARLGINWFASRATEGGICIVGPTMTDAEHRAGMVRFGTSAWTQKIWDVIIPATYYPLCLEGEGAITPAAQASSLCIWMQLCHQPGSTAPTTQAWFADAELYINPVGI